MLNPKNAEIIYTNQETKVVFLPFEVIIKHKLALFDSFEYLCFYGVIIFRNDFSAGIVFRRMSDFQDGPSAKRVKLRLLNITGDVTYQHYVASCVGDFDVGLQDIKVETGCQEFSVAEPLLS